MSSVHPTFDGTIVTPSAGTIRQFDQIPDILTMDIPPIEWIVDGLIARNTMTMVTGSDGTAKTFLFQRMAIEVARGGTFLGRRCRRIRVLYLDYENPGFAVRERLELMAGTPVEGLKVWGTWLESQPPQIGNEVLLTMAKEIKPLIIIDPFRYAHGAEENDSTEMMGVMQCLRYCASAGGAVVILHHPSRAEGSTGRGSTAIKGAVDFAYLQEMNDESGLITLACTKNRFGERHAVTIRPDYDEGTFTITDSPQFTRRAAEIEKLQAIIQANPGWIQNAISKAASMMKARAAHLLKEGIDSFWTASPGQNRSVHYYPLGWFPNLRTTDRTTEPPDEQSVGGSGGSPLKGREPQNHTTSGTAPGGSRCFSTGSEKPNGNTLRACPSCGSFALYRTEAGAAICQTCEAGQA